MLRLIPLFALALGAAAILASCGDGPDDPTPGRTVTTAARPSTPTAAGSPIRLTNPTVTASGLQYTDQVVGTGASPSANQTVTVHYTGKLAANGKKFDSSLDRGQPATFAMNGVIKGFSEGLSTMKIGGKRTVYIPAALGYGAAGFPPAVPPNADLVFEIELIAIR